MLLNRLAEHQYRKQTQLRSVYTKINKTVLTSDILYFVSKYNNKTATGKQNSQTGKQLSELYFKTSTPTMQIKHAQSFLPYGHRNLCGLCAVSEPM